MAYTPLAEEQHAVAAADSAHYVNHTRRLAGALGDGDGVEPAAEAPAEEAHGGHVLAGDEIHVVGYMLRDDEKVQIRGVVGEDENRLVIPHRMPHPYTVGSPGYNLENRPEERVYAPVKCVRMTLLLFPPGAHSVQTSSGFSAYFFLKMRRRKRKML